MRPPSPADDAQAMAHVRLDLFALHRIEMVHCDHALAELFEPVRAVQPFAEFGLAEQKDLQQRMAGGLEV